MSSNKRRLRGQAELGSAIDERLRRRSTAAQTQEGLGQAPAAPLSGGGSPGGGGEAGDEPAYPESAVESIATGADGPARQGSFELLAAGTLGLAEEAGPGSGGTGNPDWRLLLEAKSLLAVEELPASGDGEILYHLLDDGSGGDGGVWWDALADGGWVQLSAPQMWQREDGVLSPAAAGDRVEMTASESPGISRGVIRVEYSGSALQNSAGQFIASSESGLVYGVDARCYSSGGYAISALNLSSGAGVVARASAGMGIDVDRILVHDLCDLVAQSESPALPPAGSLRVYALPGGLWLSAASAGPWALLSRVRLGTADEAGSGGLGPGGSTAPAELSQPRLALIPGPGIALAAADVIDDAPLACESAFTLSAAPAACLALSDAVAGTASETAFPGAAWTIPAAALAAGSLIRISARGVFSCDNSASSEALRLRLYAGATLLLDSGAQTLAPGSSPDGRGWRLDADLVCAAAGSSGSLECQGCFSYHPAAAALAAFDLSASAPASLSTIDPLELSLSVQWSSALSSSSITLRQFIVECFAPPI